MKPATKTNPEKEEQTPQQNPPNAVESARIGEIHLQSEILGADHLLGLIFGALKNEDVRRYLNIELNSDQKKVLRGVG